MSGGGARRLRLFFALWPSDVLRAELAAAAASACAQVKGEPVPPGNLHVTLVFLGSAPGAALAPLIEAGGQEPWPAVELGFGRLEYWAKPRVLVAMPLELPPAGREIVDRLWKAVVLLGFERESRPWQPHVTLVRRVRRPPPENLTLAPVEASAWRLALVESTAHPEGVRYKPLAEWPLS